jgi:hypothetical protein
MADEVKTLKPIPALYDFILYWECAGKDWKKGAKKTSIKGDGSLMDLIDWNSTYSYDPDDAGGKTLFGVTESTWQEYVKNHPEKGYSKDLNKMGKKGWMDQVEWFWTGRSSCGFCANYACAFSMIQMVWLGFDSEPLANLLSTLKENADIKDYPFITSGGVYRKIADATHAYTDPMIAYEYMRKAHSAYLFNISTPNRTNKKYRMGWLNRSVLAYTPYGLYVPITVSGKSVGLKYESSLDQWEAAAQQLAQSNAKGYVKIVDWGASPETIEQLANIAYDFTSAAVAPYVSNSSNGSSSGAYSGCGGVSQLGNYTSAPDLNVEYKQSQNKEDVLNTLIGGSYTPKDIKTCLELITTDKKKNVKHKSEM